jgi:hypothetical protein
MKGTSAPAFQKVGLPDLSTSLTSKPLWQPHLRGIFCKPSWPLHLPSHCPSLVPLPPWHLLSWPLHISTGLYLDIYFPSLYTSLGSLPPSHLFIPGLYNSQTSPIFPDLNLSGLYTSLASIPPGPLYMSRINILLASRPPWLLCLLGL